jgi:four helix bundle protein
VSKEKSQQLKDRTEAFAIANYRASCRARSRAEFTAKIGVVAEEADESEYSLGLLLKLQQGPNDEVETWRREADELTAIFTASFRTARSRR